MVKTKILTKTLKPSNLKHSQTPEKLEKLAKKNTSPKAQKIQNQLVFLGVMLWKTAKLTFIGHHSPEAVREEHHWSR